MTYSKSSKRESENDVLKIQQERERGGGRRLPPMKLVVKTVNGSALNVDVQENEKVEGKENMTIRKQVKQYVQVYSIHEKNERKRGKKI